jgi:esterase/lipase
MKQNTWMLMLFLFFAAGCASQGKSRFDFDKKYQTFGESESSSFDEYQRNIKNILRKNWGALSGPDSDYPKLTEEEIDKLVAEHTPTDREPHGCKSGNRQARGMLLIHGLYDSPRVMRDLENYFNNRCFHTRTILLPGHGTRPGSLLHIRYQQWVAAVDNAVELFGKEFKGDIYITGFSTGGALGLKKALEENSRIKGLFLFAPALRVSDGLPRFLHGIGMKWVLFQKLDDSDLIKYESMTLDSVIEVGKLADEVRDTLIEAKTKIDIPVMLVIAENDYTIKTKTAIRLYQQGWFGEKSEMLIYAPIKEDGQCIKEIRPGDPSATPKLATYIGSCFVYKAGGKEYLIADYSHMALTLGPDDAHYGLEGDYKYCTQYFYSHAVEGQCKHKGNESTDVCFGERGMIGSVRYPQCEKQHLMVRRLTSNPQFNELTNYMDGFIKRYIDDTL